MIRRSSNIQRRAVDLRRPWVSQRGTSPLALAIRLEQDAAREATSRESPLELLQRATAFARMAKFCNACRLAPNRPKLEGPTITQREDARARADVARFEAFAAKVRAAVGNRVGA